MKDMRLGLKNMTVVIYEVDDIDFVENKSDFELITEMIDKKLESIF